MPKFKITTLAAANTEAHVETYVKDVKKILSRLHADLSGIEDTEGKIPDPILKKIKNELSIIKDYEISNAALVVEESLEADKDILMEEEEGDENGAEAKKLVAESAETPEEQAKKKAGEIFSPVSTQLEKYPHLWTLGLGFGTKRIGGSQMVLNQTILYDSTYEQLVRQFKEWNASIPKFFATPEQKKARQKINRAWARLEQLQKQAGMDYLVRLRDATVGKLKTKVFKPQLINDLDEITSLQSSHLHSSADALTYTKKVNKLRNDLYDYADYPEIKKLAQQLSVVTKSWLDPFYSNPENFTIPERARKIIKLLSVNIAALCTIGAVVCMFLFPPAVPFLALGGFVGMLPVIDDIVEVGRNLYHGRTPTKAQVLSLGIVIPLLGGLIFAAQALPAIGQAIITHAPNIGNGLINIGTFVGEKFMNFFGATLNSVFSILGVGEVKAAMRSPIATSANKLQGHAQVELNTFRNIQLERLQLEQQLEAKKQANNLVLQNIEGAPANEKNLKSAGQILSAKSEKTDDGQKFLLRFAFFTNNELKLKGSYAGDIRNWDDRAFKGLFSSNAADNIYKAVNDYCNLDATADITKREFFLGIINEKIEIWNLEAQDPKAEKLDRSKRTSQRWASVVRLKGLVEKEKAALNSIRQANGAELTVVYKKKK